MMNKFSFVEKNEAEVSMNSLSPIEESPEIAASYELEQDLVQLGARIRAARKDRRITIRAVSEACGLSSGLISQIEQGRTSPSLRTLRLLAGMLDVPISAFFDQQIPQTRADSIVRKNERRLLKLSGSLMKELLSPSTLQHLEVFEVTLQPGGSSGPAPYTHAGEKAGLILAGSLTLWLDGKAYVLEEGDLCQFMGSIPHRYDNTSNNVTRVLWVLTPPST